jgi:hypothetical protein
VSKVDDSLTECPDCGCVFCPAVHFSIPFIARLEHVKVKTVKYWMAVGWLSYRVRAIGGHHLERFVDWPRYVRFLREHRPDPFLCAPDDDRLALRLWRKRRENAKRAEKASAAARRARREAKSSMSQATSISQRRRKAGNDQ